MTISFNYFARTGIYDGERAKITGAIDVSLLTGFDALPESAVECTEAVGSIHDDDGSSFEWIRGYCDGAFRGRWNREPIDRTPSEVLSP